MQKQNYLTYEEFGAVGDGVTDDFDAICACHAYANEHRIPVKVSSGKYYIGGETRTCEIKTDTNFGDAHFIIDDTKVIDKYTPVFHVGRDHEMFSPRIDSLPADIKHLDIGINAPCYVRVFSDQRKVFIRKGPNKNNGVDLSDCFLVDENGNLLMEPDYEFEQISKVVAYRTDDTPLEITGGHFLTIANQAESLYTYYHRGIQVERSHTTVRNLKHYVTGEGEHGAPYDGFVTVHDCMDFTIADCVLTPHFTYQTESQIPGKLVPMGSYDFSAGAVIGLVMKNITQTIDIMDRRYWGIMATNFCKNMTLDGCTISRFDAHMGVTNISVMNCRLGYMCFSLIGHGTVRMENTEAVGRSLINLRDDYGSNFDGTLILKNNVWNPIGDRLTVINAYNNGDHDFGYPCYITRKIVIDGLLIKDDNGSDPKKPIAILPDYDPDFQPGKPFAPIGPEYLKWSNICSEVGRNIIAASRIEEYPDLLIEQQ